MLVGLTNELTRAVPHQDDPTIAEGEVLLRRVHPAQIVSDEAGQPRISSAAFKDPELSVDLHSVLSEAGYSVNFTLRDHPAYGLASITAGQVRAANQLVCRDPLPSNPAHALVVGNKTSSVARQLAKLANLVVIPK